MNKVVLDASAIVALLFKEPGSEHLTSPLMDNSAISTVNLAEVQVRLVRAGVDPEEAWIEALAPVRDIHPFVASQAKIAGSLVAQTRSLGLSLGDRACLALAISLKATVYTTDRAWRDVRVGVPIHVIR